MWVTVQSSSGKSYYYHTTKGISSWSKTTPPQNAAHHYDMRPRETPQQRTKDPHSAFRLLQNWCKGKMLHRAWSGGDDFKVLDLCCGQGGDLPKFAKMMVVDYVGVDVSSQSLEEAKRRCKLRKAQFIQHDLTTSIELSQRFDLVNVQMALHYFTESEATLRTFLGNIADHLQQGGKSVLTFPNPYRIIQEVKRCQSPHVHVGMAQLQCTPAMHSAVKKWTSDDPIPYGWTYSFTLQHYVVKCAEYVVPLESTLALAQSLGMEVEFQSPFHNVIMEHLLHDPSPALPRDALTNPLHWDTAGLYYTLTLVKK